MTNAVPMEFVIRLVAVVNVNLLFTETIVSVSKTIQSALDIRALFIRGFVYSGILCLCINKGCRYLRASEVPERVMGGLNRVRKRVVRTVYG